MTTATREAGAPTGAAPPSADAAIVTSGLTKRFRGGQVAVDALDLVVPRGSVYGFLGPNGSGKTTTIRMLLGLITPTDGDCSLLGLPLAQALPRVGALVEGPAFYPYLTGEANLLRFDAADPTASGATARRRVAEALDRVGLTAAAGKRYRNYSLGMRQRLAIAAALLGPRELLILDEPTNGLDPRGRDEMLTLVRRIGAEFGISVLVTSHLLGELERICDHVIVIDGGRLLRSSAITEFTQATETVAVEVDEGADVLAGRLAELGQTVTPHGRTLLVKVSGPETYDAVRDATADLGLCLIRLEQRRGRIEDVFREEAARV